MDSGRDVNDTDLPRREDCRVFCCKRHKPDATSSSKENSSAASQQSLPHHTSPKTPELQPKKFEESEQPERHSALIHNLPNLTSPAETPECLPQHQSWRQHWKHLDLAKRKVIEMMHEAGDRTILEQDGVVQWSAHSSVKPSQPTAAAPSGKIMIQVSTEYTMPIPYSPLTLYLRFMLHIVFDSLGNRFDDEMKYFDPNNDASDRILVKSLDFYSLGEVTRVACGICKKICENYSHRLVKCVGCGHIVGFKCLRHWIGHRTMRKHERFKECPVCLRKVEYYQAWDAKEALRRLEIPVVQEFNESFRYGYTSTDAAELEQRIHVQSWFPIFYTEWVQLIAGIILDLGTFHQDSWNAEQASRLISVVSRGELIVRGVRLYFECFDPEQCPMLHGASPNKNKGKWFQDRQKLGYREYERLIKGRPMTTFPVLTEKVVQTWDKLCMTKFKNVVIQKLTWLLAKYSLTSASITEVDGALDDLLLTCVDDNDGIHYWNNHRLRESTRDSFKLLSESRWNAEMDAVDHLVNLTRKKGYFTNATVESRVIERASMLDMAPYRRNIVAGFKLDDE